MLVTISTTAAAAPSVELVRVPVETVATERPSSRTIYLNRHGGVVRPGASDSRANTSSLITLPAAIQAWNPSAATWQRVVDCLVEIWAPFDVAITDIDPGNVPHFEAMFTTSPSSLRMPPKIGGVAPMSTTCAVVENAIVFVFTDNLSDARSVCEVAAQELGHGYGLDHELDAADPMTYLSYSGDRSFQDRTVACGETKPRPCGIGGNVCRAEQNSFAILLERLAPEDEDDAPPVEPTEELDREVGLALPAGCSTTGSPSLLLVFLLVLRRRSW